MHFKAILASLISGELIATTIFARALALLSLATGCLASRAWQSGSPLATLTN